MISTALMKEQLKRFWPFMLLSTLAYTLFIVLPTIVEAGRGTLDRAQGMIELLSMGNLATLALTVLVPFVVVMMLFSYLFKPKATEAFYAFTSSKNQLFWTNAVTGLILTVVPLILMSLLLLIRVRAPGAAYMPELAYPANLFSRDIAAGVIINTFGAVASFFARMLVSTLFVYALVLFGATMSSSWIVATLISGILTIAPLLVHRLGLLIGQIYVAGYYPVDSMRPMTLLSYINPLAWQWNFDRLAQPIYFLIYLGITVVLLGLASVCFAARKMEKAEQTIVFSSFKNVVIFLMSIVGMIAMGGFMINILTGRWFLYYGFVLGFAIAFCVLHILFEKNFNIKHKIKQILPLAGVVAALYGIVLLVTMFGMRGFVHEVPAPARVAGVYVSAEGFAKHRNDFDTSDEAIAEAIAAHELILDVIDTRSDLTRQQRRDMSGSDRRDHNSDRRDARSDMRDTHWQSVTGGGRQFIEDGGRHMYITYLLNNGDHVYRRYALSNEFILRNRLGAMLAGADAMTPYDALSDVEAIESITLRFDDGNFSFDFEVTDQEEIAMFAGVMLQDIAADELSDYDILVRVDVEDYGTVSFIHEIGAYMGAMMEQMM